MATAQTSSSVPAASNFIRDIIDEDLRTGATGGKVITRFPPEPNGYLHIGHAKAICLNFGLAQDYNGRCHLRFDDTNPTTEDMEYVESIKNDVRWLGFDWNEHLYFASDYFEELYFRAEKLIKAGKAYVDDQTEEEIRKNRGTVTEPGVNSPYRDRSVEENLDLFRRMRAGEFEDGSRVLRAKIDMAAHNMLMRDPLIFRIRHAHHYRTGDAWCIYPMYDFAHPLSDALENVTHSLCSLEFEVHRPVYDWFVENTFDPPLPHQYEFARLNLDYTVMSKRKLLRLVNEGCVSGWDDPRMPTLSGMRRRGITPASIRMFADMIGVAKADNRIDIGLLEYCIRTDLNDKTPRVMAVLDPLKLVITNYPEEQSEELECAYFPHDINKEGTRMVPFGREVYIDRSDFSEDPPKGFYRLSPGAEVRLRYAYIIRCEEVVKDDGGQVCELRCTFDPATKSGSDTSGKKVKGTIQWVSAERYLSAKVRLYDRLFSVANPDEGDAGFKSHINPDSVQVVDSAVIEESVAHDPVDTRYQFTRLGYFVRDAVDATSADPVFNRIVTLRDTWAKKAASDEPASRDAPAESTASQAPLGPTFAERVAQLSTKPKERYNHYSEAVGLNKHDALVLAENREIRDFFEAAHKGGHDARAVANWVINELPAVAREVSLEKLKFGAGSIGELVGLIERGVISRRIAKEVLAEMVDTGASPVKIVEEKGLEQVSNSGALTPIIDRLVKDHSDKVAAYKSGKTGLIGFFVGQVMRETSGKADPKLVQQLLLERLG